MVSFLFWYGGDEASSLSISISSATNSQLGASARQRNLRVVDVLREASYLFGTLTESQLIQYLKVKET